MNYPTLTETFEKILYAQLPNFYRLYLNPYVAQTCFCLGEYVRTTWNQPEDHQTFLANSCHEALSGAIKLARYNLSLANRTTQGLILDPDDKLGPFAGTPGQGGYVEFLPGIVVVNSLEDFQKADRSPEDFGFVVILNPCDMAVVHLWQGQHDILLITWVTRSSLSQLRQATTEKLREQREVPVEERQGKWGRKGEHGRKGMSFTCKSLIKPDVVVFDESFVNRQVPFGAFTAKKKLYEPWNQPQNSTFHSTTFQPNTVSCLHFLRCLEYADVHFFETVTESLERIQNDINYRVQVFLDQYSPALIKAIKMTNSVTTECRAVGEFIYTKDRKIFDCVGGVACSIRGHNPPNYIQELQSLENHDAKTLLTSCLREHTGLDHLLSAVSGASGVETALKIALTAQYPRRHVLVLKGGFGGKTLFALTGTWKATYKENIGPLYKDVIYVDPFAEDAVNQIETSMQQYEIGVVQVELIQGVSGVRPVPESVLAYLQSNRLRHGYLLLVDEVQTGMFRTGPLCRSQALGLKPDLLILGKATSDMMFPFALVQYSEAIQQKLMALGSDLVQQLQNQYDYPVGYRTVLNVLKQAKENRLADHVIEAGTMVETLLLEGVASCRNVSNVRVFGLLIGIELNNSSWLQRWFTKKLFWFYLASMLQHSTYPVLVGFCQAEPNVLKLTPPLTTSPEELKKLCSTLIEVLNRPFIRLFAQGIISLI